jgi:hypothetical protein
MYTTRIYLYRGIGYHPILYLSGSGFSALYHTIPLYFIFILGRWDLDGLDPEIAHESKDEHDHGRGDQLELEAEHKHKHKHNMNCT